jgi:hypothetical protein
MSPEHHEERLRVWTIKTGRPVLSIDYGKAPECMSSCYPIISKLTLDVFQIPTLLRSTKHMTHIAYWSNLLVRLLECQVRSSILSCPETLLASRGATIAVNVVMKILEHNNPSLPPRPAVLYPKPLALVLNYAALDFNFTSWMSPANLRVLRSEQSTGNLPGLRELAAQKDHLQHVSPLSMVGDKRSSASRGKRLRRKTSWRDTLRGFTSGTDKEGESPALQTRHSSHVVRSHSSIRTLVAPRRGQSNPQTPVSEDMGDLADAESDEDEDFDQWREEDRPIQARVRHLYTHSPEGSAGGSGSEKRQEELALAVKEADCKIAASKKVNEPIGTRLTMTSRTGYFQDRIVSPSMVSLITNCKEIY